MPNFSGIWTVTQQMQAKGASTWPATPGAPTIGTATAGTNNCGSVTFTAPACAGFPATITGYRVVSTPGCISNTGASSPIVVSGLTNGTSYTFKAQAQNATGYGALSAASNSITATVITCATYTTPGTYSWVAPSGVTSVAVVAVSGGGPDKFNNGVNGRSGSGGNLGYKNNIPVTPGSSYSVYVGTAGQPAGTGCPVDGGPSGFGSGPTPYVYGGTNACNNSAATINADGGGRGGNGVLCTYGFGGGGGAGGYSGNGGNGVRYVGPPATGGAGGGGGGGSAFYQRGGGVGLLGQGCSGSAGNPGSGGSGIFYGGGGAGNEIAGPGAVRIVWCVGGIRGTPSFPSTNVGA